MERSEDVVKEELLVLAKQFHQFCVDNSIKYSIHGGTMLGAVREKGFIPWDDDIDVTFTRTEYTRFEQLFSNIDSANLILNKQGLYPRLVMKRVDRPVVWIDIFVYDFITENPFFKRIKITILKIYNLLFRDLQSLEFTKNNSKGNYLRYMLIAGLVRYGNATNREKLLKRAHKMMTAFSGTKKWLCRTNDTIEGLPKIIPGYAMNKYEIIQFENIELMISSYWDEILTSSYGKDYMVPRHTTDPTAHNAFIDNEIKNAETAFLNAHRGY